MKKALVLAAVALLLVFVSSCRTAAPPDTTAPQVVSLDPAAGAVGVTKTTSISIVFNEPMDTASVEAAYGSSSEGLKPAQVTFTWEDGDKKLVISPKAELAYSPNATPIIYSFALAGSAADKAGNSLGTTLVSSFSTLRTLSATLTGESIDGYIEDDGAGSYTAFTSGSPVFVGIQDSSGGMFSCHRAYFSFPLSGLPEGVTEFTAADLQLYSVEYPDDNFNNSFLIAHVDYGDSLDAGDFNGPLFSGSSVETINLGDQVTNHRDVAEWLQASIDAGGDRFQVRLWMDGCATLSVDAKYGYDINASEASSNKPQLVVSYLAP